MRIIYLYNQEVTSSQDLRIYSHKRRSGSPGEEKIKASKDDGRQRILLKNYYKQLKLIFIKQQLFMVKVKYEVQRHFVSRS